jgi:predicted DNA-binding transcriptional regulator AlpA
MRTSFLVARAAVERAGVRPEVSVDWARATGATDVGLELPLLDEPVVAAARAASLLLGVWTVNDESAMRRMLARGATIRQAEARLQTPRSTLGRLAKRHKLPRRRRMLSGEKAAAVRRLMGRGLGGRRISDEAGVSRSTVWRHQQRAGLVRLKSLTAPLPCKPWRCPGCGGLLNLSICITCNFRKPARIARPQAPPGTSETQRS